MSYGLMLYFASDYMLTLDELKEQLQGMFIEYRETNKPEPRYKMDQYGNVVEDQSTTTEFFEMVDEAMNVVYRTFVHLDVPKNWRTVPYLTQPLIEFRSEVEILTGGEDDLGRSLNAIMFQFQVDWVAKNLNDGLTYLVDWKSRKSFEDSEYESVISGETFNSQMSLYQKCLQLLGIKTDGSICFQISPYNPKIPNYLESRKRVSKENIKTDWQTYSETLIQYGENPDDPYYSEMKTKLGEPSWFSPITLFRSQSELDKRWEDARNWTKIIYSEKQQYLPIMNSTCKFCPFSKICIGIDNNYDIQEMINTEYVRKVE
jgi:hypothetical protein